MDLTPDQLRAARARGCVLAPATDDQVRRLRMQRRIFSVDGLPFVAARDGFFETHGTLAALIEAREPGAAIAPPPCDPAADDAGPPPTGAEPGAARAGQDDRRAMAAAKPRKPRAPRRAPADTDAAPSGEAAAAPSVAEEMLAGVEAAQGRGPGARVVGRRRAGQPPTPRWMVAGKMRRGRLK